MLWIAIQYKFPEDSFIRSDDLAKKHSESIVNSLPNNDPGKMLIELNFHFPIRIFFTLPPYPPESFFIIFIFFIEVKKLFHEINLKKVIEEKLTNNNRVMNTIGRPIQIEFNPKKDLTMSENAAKVYFKKIN